MVLVLFNKQARLGLEISKFQHDCSSLYIFGWGADFLREKIPKVYFLITCHYGVNINHKMELLNLNVQGAHSIKSICLVGPLSFVS